MRPHFDRKFTETGILSSACVWGCWRSEIREIATRCVTLELLRARTLSQIRGCQRFFWGLFSTIFRGPRQFPLLGRPWWATDYNPGGDAKTAHFLHRAKKFKSGNIGGIVQKPPKLSGNTVSKSAGSTVVPKPLRPPTPRACLRQKMHQILIHRT